MFNLMFTCGNYKWTIFVNIMDGYTQPELYDVEKTPITKDHLECYKKGNRLLLADVEENVTYYNCCPTKYSGKWHSHFLKTFSLPPKGNKSINLYFIFFFD